MKAAQDSIKKVKLQIQNAVELKQSCKIYVTTKTEESWSFYFKKGYLIWASNSIHRFRRLYRLTNKICPEVNCQNIKLREQEITELWEYLLIAVIYKRQQITILQIKEIIQELIKEILFDCLLGAARISQIKVIFETKENGMGAILRSPLFKQPIVQIDYKKIISNLEALVVDWQTINWKNCSPNFAPVIKDIERLKQAVEPTIYQQLFIHINGDRTLRDLAIAARQDLLNTARLLAPYVKNKSIMMQQVRDRQLANLYFTPSNSIFQTREHIKELDLPLIIYVDDNPFVCQQAVQILNPLGYRIIPVKDAAKTLVVLLENEASLIFLDATMSDANGYELCAQIRKMPACKNIPIIISRKQENMLDLVRAKMAGVTDFIDKPINSSQLSTIAQKYTQSVTSLVKGT